MDPVVAFWLIVGFLVVLLIVSLWFHSGWLLAVTIVLALALAFAAFLYYIFLVNTSE